MKTYKCIPCDRIITKTNKLNHENTEFHINNSLNKDNPSYKTCVSCKRVKDKTNFYNEKSKCKNCLKEYRKGNVKCQICNTITTRNYYHNHMKKHPVLIPIIGKICSKCNIDKPKDSFHNDIYKEDGKKTICKECVKVSKDRELSNNSSYQNVKRTLDIKHIECTICNKIISKTN
jgi:hypothetical protein